MKLKEIVDARGNMTVITTVDCNGTLQYDGKTPSMRKYDKGEVSPYEISFFKDGAHHRIGGPAITRKANGEIDFEVYCINGLIHREDGPALIRKNSQKWFWKGIEYSFKAWCERAKLDEKKEYELAIRYL